MRTKNKKALLIICLLCSACAELEQKKWYQQTRDATTATVTKVSTQVSTVTTKAAGRMRDYLSRKQVLEQFHDAGEHSEDALLSVLRRAGVGTMTASTSKPPRGQTGKPKASSTPPTPTPNSPSAGAGKTAGIVANNANKFPSSYQGNYRWPLDAGIVSSEYGQRWGKMHKGLDIAADVGEPVYAAAAGEVIYSGNGMRGYGNAVVLRHDDRATTLYAHNSALSVKVGQKVTQGEQIALLGNTGHSTGPHIHFEIRSGDAPVDPRSLLPKSMNAWLMPDVLMLNRNDLFASVWPGSSSVMAF